MFNFLRKYYFGHHHTTTIKELIGIVESLYVLIDAVDQKHETFEARLKLLEAKNHCKDFEKVITSWCANCPRHKGSNTDECECEKEINDGIDFNHKSDV